jgi:hypothetical protein
MTPDTVRKTMGYQDKKEISRSQDKLEEISVKRGIPFSLARFVRPYPSKTIIDESPNHTTASLNLSAAQVDISSGIYQVLLTIMKSHGIRHVLGANEDIREDQSWLGKLSKLPKVILSLPGIDALKNITKSGFNLLLTPLKLAAKTGLFFDKLRTKFKDFVFSKLFTAQSQEELFKAAGIEEKSADDYWKLAGANTLDAIKHYGMLSTQYLKMSVGLLEVIAGKEVDKTDIEALEEQGPKIWDYIRGKYVKSTDNFMKRAMEFAIAETYNKGLVGKISNTIAAMRDYYIGKSAEKSYEEQVGRSTKAYSRVHKIKSEEDLEKILSRPDYRIIGYGSAEEQSHILTEGRWQKGKGEFAKVATTLKALKGSSTMYSLLGLGFLTGGIGGLAMALGGVVAQAYYGGKAEDIFRKSQRDILEKDIKEQGGGELNYFKSDISKIRMKDRGKGGMSVLTPAISFSEEAQKFSTSIKDEIISAISTVGDLLYKPIDSILSLLTQTLTPETRSPSGSLRLIRGQKKLLDAISKNNLLVSDALKEIKDIVMRSTDDFDPDPRSKVKFYNNYRKYNYKNRLKEEEKLYGFGGGVVPGVYNGKKGKDGDTTVAHLTPGEVVLSRDEVKNKENLESFRWKKLIESVKGTHDLLKGKFSYYFRDFWEDLKFRKKKKKEDSSSTGWFSSGILGLLAGLFGKMFKGGKSLLKLGALASFIPLKFLGRIYGDSLKLLFGDVKKVAVTLLKKPSIWLTDKFKEHILKPFISTMGRVGSSFGEILLKSKTFLKSTVDDVLLRSKGFLGTKIIRPLTSFFGSIFESVMKHIPKLGLSSMSGGLFSKIAEPIMRFITSITSKFFGSSGLLKGLGKFGLGFLKRLPGLNVLFGAYDAITGFSNASEITGQENPSFFHKLGAGVAGLVSGLTFGIVEPKTIYSLFGEGADFISQKISGFGDWFLNVGPIKSIREFLGYTGEKDENPERSFISRAWEKFQEISKDSFNWLCNVPVIGTPFSLLRDGYNLLFGDEEKPETKKSFFMKMIDDIKSLDLDTFLSRMLGSLYTTFKELYDKVFGDGASKNAIDWGKEKVSQAKQTISKTYDKIASTETGGKVISLAKEAGSYIGDKLSKFKSKVFSPPSEDDLKKETINIGGYTIRSDVYQAIQQASSKYGVPLDYMLAMAHKESGFNPSIKAPTSSATGLFQFINKTWKGLWGTPTPDPKDPYANADAAARYTKQIQEQLSTSDPASLYLGHFLGSSGASKLLKAMNKNSETLATDVVSPDQIRANKSVFKENATVADIYEWANRSIGKTMAKIGKIDKSINSLASLQQKQLEPQYQRQEPRNQLNIQPVGQIEDFNDKIQEASMKPQPSENEPPVIPVQEAQREIQPVVLNVSQPTQTQVSTPINREQPLPKQLTDILNSIFDSTVAVFTQTNKAFVFGESLNANPLMI